MESDARRSLDELRELWKRERSRVERYGDEHGLEHGFIKPAMAVLGWKLKYQPYLHGRKPDYALFLSDAALDAALTAERRSPEFWRHAAVVADAKAWHIALDRPTTIDNQREYPPQQMEWYLDRSRRDYGILTNGRRWRLIPREREPYQGRFDTYYEFNLESFLEDCYGRVTVSEEQFQEFLFFYLLFGPDGYRETAERKSLVRRAVEGSSEYRIGIGDDLRERAFEALRLSTEGFLSYRPNGLDAETDLENCRNEGFVLLYRLLFIMFAEDRGLLPYGKNELYTTNRSLRRHRDEIGSALDRIHEHRQADYSRREHGIWDDIRALFDLLDRGHGRYGVPAYNGGLFDSEEHPFLEQNKLSDWHLARVIDQLGRAIDPTAPRAGLFRVDYRDLAIQHLGGIYEGLLELRPKYASHPMVVIARRARDRIEERTILASHPTPSGYERTETRYEVGQVYLQTNKGERRATGSYYTPDHIVKYIVEQTIVPVCRSIDEELQREIAALEQSHSAESNGEGAVRLEALKSDFDNRVLALSVLDPAMGSGHFLLRACAQLAEEIATHPFTGDDNAPAAEESSLTYWKRRVAENCLYGVDMNGLAVELAKLALWLETVAADQPLTFLNHHLRTGNSLIGARIQELSALPDDPEIFAQQVVDAVDAKLPLLLEPLNEIRNTPSKEMDQVKRKDRLFKSLDKARDPFRRVANVWCSTFALPEQRRIHRDDYLRLVDEIGRPRRFEALTGESGFQVADAAANAADFRCFHWELEFPEVFFDESGRKPNGGFQVIIGNPPYDVLSELESGRDLSAFRAFINHEAIYLPSLRGKNNLYKLFICRALDLLAADGYLGLITPMAVLGDYVAAEIRKTLIENARFTVIDAFPQKDDRRKRVFPDAKLSTATFVIRKNSSQPNPCERSTSRVHPGRDLSETSATLSFANEDIALYDPANLTIVSCSQADFDLATRIMKTGRMCRLKDRAEFFQGEVNETNERHRGNLASRPAEGSLVVRGANLCLYVLRPASQGRDIFLNVKKFLNGRDPDSKAFHFEHARVGLQESCPQNNFRRIIASFIRKGEFCNHKVNYCPEHKCSVDLRVVLALLNSKLADWYFRLGSTNAAVSHYQLYNLPFPAFSESIHDLPMEAVLQALAARQVDTAFSLVAPQLADAPFSGSIADLIAATVDRIIAIEKDRGEIPRTARSALAPEAQPYQNFIDRLFYRMAGLADDEIAGLEERYARML